MNNPQKEIKTKINEMWGLLSLKIPETPESKKQLNVIFSKITELHEEINSFFESPISDFIKKNGDINQNAIGSNIIQNAK